MAAHGRNEDNLNPQLIQILADFSSRAKPHEPNRDSRPPLLFDCRVIILLKKALARPALPTGVHLGLGTAKMFPW